ncbi:oligosaccharide flippase family protein [Bizionia sp.]|uniref:oligosaccharide flippase family protein n=1 Tax=Bizionia sp. TaxID=1954480 RepID=UPI003A937D94
MNKQEVSDNKQTFWLAFGKIIALLATLAVPLFLTRFLDKDEYGFYNQFNTVLFFLSSFFSFGMYSNIFYFYPSLEKNKIKSLLVHTLLFLLGFSLLAGLFIFIPVFSNFFLANEQLQNYKITIYFLTIVLTITSIIHPLYVVRKDIGISVWFPSFQVAIKAIAIVGFFLIIPNIESVINAIVISSILVLLIIASYLYKIFKNLPVSDSVDKKLMLEQFKYNLPIGLSVGLKTFSQKFDKLIGITYLSASSYASYSVAFFGIPGIQQVYDAISQVTIVNMVTCFVNDEVEKAHELYKTMVVKTMSFSVPIILIVSINAKEIITFLFTDKYADATILFQIYLVSFIFVMLGAGLILRASGHTKFIIRAFLFASIISIPATYVLIKQYGSIGAMCGALLSIILPKIYQVKKEIEITKSSFKSFLPWKNIGKVFLISIICLMPFIFLNIHFHTDNIVYVILLAIIYLSIVALIEIKLNIFIISQTKVMSIVKDIKSKIK